MTEDTDDEDDEAPPCEHCEGAGWVYDDGPSGGTMTCPFCDGDGKRGDDRDPESRGETT